MDWSSLSVLVAAVVVLVSLAIFKFQRTPTQKPAENTEVPKVRDSVDFAALGKEVDEIKVIYGTVQGTSQRLAHKICSRFSETTASFRLVPVSAEAYEPEELVTEPVVLFILPTWENGQPPPPASWLCSWIRESYCDERIGASYLKNTHFAVFGLGNSQYADNFNVVGRSVHDQLCKMGAVSILGGPGEGDQDLDNINAAFNEWTDSLIEAFLPNQSTKRRKQAKQAPKPVIVEESDSASDNDEDSADIEDLVAKSGKTKNSKAAEAQSGPREMVTPALKEALTKQGYRIVGSHSGVKICRWTKAMLRGRGGCYKHTFYGIASHRCMEATPSLACANKCVFCWRHHTNPVGKEWKWQKDDPQTLIEGFMNNHYQMIKQMRGVPGVKPERLEEANQIRHCALSLVGEPIMYPHINEFIGMLHRRRISSYLVTNAQFPEAIERLDPVTQLYVSVDAATPESLKAVDRPLFTDFWERFIASLEALKKKEHTRSVYRLTLVSKWNTAELADYAKLVARGQPDFVEIKGVTFCGSSKASPLTMENVPFHADVVEFAQNLSRAINELVGGDMYTLAIEHQHSCCVCVAHSRFRVNGQWRTWIDYEKFQDLWHEWSTTGRVFNKEEYTLPTPEWALFGAQEHGFDPEEARVFVKGSKKPPSTGC